MKIRSIDPNELGAFTRASADPTPESVQGFMETARQMWAKGSSQPGWFLSPLPFAALSLIRSRAGAGSEGDSQYNSRRAPLLLALLGFPAALLGCRYDPLP